MQREAFKPYKRSGYGTDKEITARAISDAGGPKRVAERLKRSKSTVYSYADPASPIRITVEQALAITGPGVTAYAETFASAAGGLFVPFEGGRATVHQAIASLTEAAAAVACTTIRALADGRFTPDEAADALRDLDRAAESLVCARARVREAMETTP